jgi:TolB-like protein
MSQAISLIVQPFENLSGDEGSNGMARSLYMEFLLQFSRFRQFRLVTDETLTNTSLAGYRIRAGAISASGSVRLTVQLLRAADMSVVWIDRYEARMPNLEDIADSIIAEIVSSIQYQIDEDILIRLRQVPSGPAVPYEFWLCGVEELKKGTLASDEKARVLFSRSIELDPGFALGYSGMSMSFFNEWSCQLWDRWDVSQKGAYEWAKKALDLDPRNYVACFVVGRIYLYEGKYDIAEEYLDRMLAINSNDPEILIHTAVAFVFLDKIHDAKMLYEKSVALRPLHAMEFNHVAAFIALERGDYKECLARAPEVAPWIDFPAIVAAAHYYLGDIATALIYWQRFVDNFKTRILLNDHDPTSREALQWVVNTSPYKGQTRLKEFWEYIAGADLLNYTRAVKGNTPPETENTIAVEGTLWVFTFHQNRIHVPNVKGFHDLARLLVEPEKEIHCRSDG